MPKAAVNSEWRITAESNRVRKPKNVVRAFDRLAVPSWKREVEKGR
jgi:hypothetical protein